MLKFLTAIEISNLIELCKMCRNNQNSLLCNQKDACISILKKITKNPIMISFSPPMLRIGLLTGQEDISSLSIKWEMIRLNNGTGMNLLDKFIMPKAQIISFKTTRVNSWLPMLEALLLEFQLSSQETIENGSSIKSIIWSPLKLETTQTSWDLLVPQDQTNTSKSASKTWCAKNQNIDGELSIATLVNKNQISKTSIPTTATDKLPSSLTK